jgi:hypothetical protein
LITLSGVADGSVSVVDLGSEGSNRLPEHLGRLTPPPARLAVVAGLLAILAATNRWLSWTAGFRLLLAHDEADYRLIAQAAPGLPTQRLSEQHAQRFPFHYLVGLIANAASLKVEWVYAVGVVVVVLGLCVVLSAVIAQVQVSTPVFAVCMGVFIMNTYSLRYYGLAPGEIADLLFDLGLAVVLLGLLRGRYWIVLTGICFATAARQTALPAALAVAFWVYLGPGWRVAPSRLRIFRSVALVLVPAGLFFVLTRIAAPFSAGTTPDLAHFTMLAELEHLPSGLGQLGQHLLRSVNGLLSVGALIGVAVAASRRSSPATRLPFEFWGCLLIAGSVALQPVIFSASYAAHNETRLAVLALGPLVGALAFALRELERRRAALTPAGAAAILAVLVAGSLHHLYTVVGPASAALTVTLQVIVAACLALVLWRSVAQRQT